MQNLVNFLIRYGYILLFLVLEAICFSLIIRYNQSQKEIWVNSSHLWSAGINDRSSQVKGYFQLSQENDSLRQANADLLEKNLNYKIYSKNNAYQAYINSDSLPYQFIPAVISHKHTGYRNNFITIDKGSLHGIRPDMGVMTNDGIIGTVLHVGKYYSQVMLMFNSESQISANIKGQTYIGHLNWKHHSSYDKMTLSSIPKFTEVTVGDTVVTSGYSTIFPKGMMIGTVTAYDVVEGGSTYDIDVKLSNNIFDINYVYVIDYQYQQEIDSLQNITLDEFN